MTTQQTSILKPVSLEPKPKILLLVGYFLIIVLATVSMYNVLIACCLVIAAISLPILFKKPVITILAVLAATVFIRFAGNLPGTGIGSINIPDLLLGCVFLFGMATYLQETTYKRGPLDIPLILFVLVSTLSMVISVKLHGQNLFEVIRVYKVTLYYLLGIFIPLVVRDYRSIKFLVLGAFLIGISECLRAIYEVAKAGGLPSGETFYMLQHLQGGAGNPLLYWVFCLSLALMILHKVRTFYIGALLFSAIYFSLMFHRHMYLSMAFGALLIIIICAPVKAGSLYKLAGIGIVGMLLVSAIAVRYAGVDKLIELTEKRIESIVTIEQSKSFTYRQKENFHALNKISQNPLLGIGFMENYRPAIYGPDDTIRHFVHNGYLWLLLNIGFVGLIPFLWFSFMFMKRGFKAWNQVDNGFMSAVVLGSTVAFSGMMISNFTSPYFIQDWGTVVPGLMIGINEAIYRLHEGKNITASI